MSSGNSHDERSAAYNQGPSPDAPILEGEEPVRCARCEGYDLPQLPHAIGCPLNVDPYEWSESDA